MNSVELQRSTAAVLEAKNAIGVACEAGRLAMLKSREALLDGDRVSWMISERQSESAAWRKQKLDAIRVLREELSDEARERYVASRLRREQIQRVFDDIAARIEIEEGRRSQAASDDRFLARRRWTDTQEQIKEARQIKVS